MQRKIEIFLIYLTGLMQGLILVIVPGASSVFTNPTTFGFSESHYGALFVPQVIMSIIAALLAPKISAKTNSKRVYQASLLLNCIAAALIALSQTLVGQPSAYICMMFATSAIGAAFGTTLPMINVYAQNFFPRNTPRALTALHSLLGTGTALAPILVAVFVKQIGWWVLPILSFIIVAALLTASFFLPLISKENKASVKKTASVISLGRIFWLFVVIVFLYGYCETIFANWAILYLKNSKNVSAFEASWALSAFWGVLTIGRIITAFLSTWVAPRWIYRVLPVLIIVSFWAVTMANSGIQGILFFGLAGLACSSFFPLSFGLAQVRFAPTAEKVAGALMASYMLGYGFASYGIGSIVQSGTFSLTNLYLFSAVVPLVMVLLAFVLTRE